MRLELNIDFCNGFFYTLTAEKSLSSTCKVNARILLANPQTIVFIGLNRGSGQEDFGGDCLTKQRDRALCPTSTDRLFSENYYDHDFCSEKYVRLACPVVRCSWRAGSGLLRTPIGVMPPPPQQKDVRDVATPSPPGACA